MTKKCKILFAFILIFSCKESIPDPEQVTLINPENNNTCLFSNSNANSGDVEFSWTEAKHTDNYDLIIENQLTNLKNSRTINQTFARVTLERGAPQNYKSNTNGNTSRSNRYWKCNFGVVVGNSKNLNFPRITLIRHWRFFVVLSR